MTNGVSAWEKRRLAARDDVAISTARFPHLDLTRLRPGPVEAAAPAARGRLGRGSRPLARREHEERTILPWWVGSALLHAIMLFAALYVMTPRGAPGSPEPPTVEMVFGHAGSAALQGTSVPQADQGANSPVSAPVPATSELEAPAPLLDVPPAPALPALSTPPSPAAEAAPPRQTPEQTRSARASRSARRDAASANPFAHMTDLSMAPANIARPGRGGSGGAINLSIGPMVQGGRLAMPFSMRGGHGMSSDYREMIDDWVEAHKYYPDSARQRGHDGNVTIRVVWNRDGRVLDVQLESGSGDDDLDTAWTGLFRGAHLPPPPPDVPGDPITWDMTMHYELVR